MKWLEKLSQHLSKSGPEIAVLVIDRADLITVSGQPVSKNNPFPLFFTFP